MMVDFALIYGMKNDDLLKEILMHGVNNDELYERINQNLFLDLFRGFTIGKNTKMRIALSLHTHRGKKFMARDWQHDLMSLVNYIKTHSEQQDITIGNSHKVKTDGIITTILNEQLPSEIDRWSPADIFSTAVILGSELMIRHPEHPTVNKHIPADKALLLSMQRGSSPSIQGWSD